MIEIILKNWLSNETGVQTVLEIPTPLPEEFISIEKTGGSFRDQLHTAIFAVQSWSSSMYSAASLNEVVQSALITMGERCGDVYKVTVDGGYNFTDTATKRYRYQTVVEIKY